MRKCFALILLSFIQASAQDLKVANIDISKRAFCSRIAWMDGSKFAIISDNQNGNKVFAHHIYVYDGDSLIKKQKVITDYTLYNDRTIILGKHIFFCEGLENDADAYVFNITDAIDDNGKHIETSINVFTIPEEENALSAGYYLFNSYAGVNKQHALLTYSNNYKAPHRKGFLYRTMNEKASLSLIDTLKLPYTDRECDIRDLIYDDRDEKVYLLSDIFTLTEEKSKKISYEEKDFKKSVLGCYDLKLRTYTEVGADIPSFYTNKIQHLMKKDSIVYAFLKPDIKDSGNWVASLMIVRKNPFQVAILKSCNLKPDAVINFFDDKDRKAEIDHVAPEGSIVEYRKNCFNVGWANFFTLNNDYKGGHGNLAVAAGGAAFGLIGGLIAGAATSGGVNYNVADFSGDALWLSYEEGSNEPLQKTFRHKLFNDTYDVSSYSSFTYLNNIYCIYNKMSSDSKSSVIIEKINGNNPAALPLIERLQNLNLNTIHIQTLFRKDGVAYMIGEYNPDNDWRETPLFNERKFVLFSLNEY